MMISPRELELRAGLTSAPSSLLLFCAPSSFSRPALVTGGWPAAQAIGDHPRCLVVMSAPQACDDQGVLPQLTLCMAAADPHDRRHQRFKDADRVVIVALGERSNAPTQPDRGSTRGQPAIGLKSFQFRQSC